MDLLSILIPLLIGAAIVACGALVWLVRETVLTARSVRTLSDDVGSRLVPILDKADVTVDALNAELLRIDGAITKFEEAGARVSAASETLSDFVSSPAGTVAEGVRRRWRERKRHESSEPAPVDWPEAADVEDPASAEDAVVRDTEEPEGTLPDDDTLPAD